MKNSLTIAKPKNTKRVNKIRRLAVYIRDGFVCMACGRDLREMMACCVTLDHLEPRSQGGSNEGSNLVCACWECNTGRNDRPWRDYYTPGAQIRVDAQRFKPLNEQLAGALIEGTAGDEDAEALR